LKDQQIVVALIIHRWLRLRLRLRLRYGGWDICIIATVVW
jgi:hypothetical protein